MVYLYHVSEEIRLRSEDLAAARARLVARLLVVPEVPLQRHALLEYFVALVTS